MDKLKFVAGALGLGAISLSSATEDEKKWHDYNYPPKLRLIHYSLDGLHPTYTRMSRALNINVIVVFIIQILNLINTFVQITSDCEHIRTISILYSFLSKSLSN